MNKLKQMNSYFRSNKRPCMIALWVSFGITLGYMILCMAGILHTSFWWWLIGGAVALYFRICYSKAGYDPVKDKYSDQYIPYKDRPKKSKKK